MADQDFETFLQSSTPQPATPGGAPAVAQQGGPAPVKQASDPFESFLTQQKSQQDAATMQQAQATVVANSATSADAAGKAAGVAKQIGAPQAAVETDLPRYEAQAKAQSNAQTLSADPKLASWVAANPDSARIAQDDLSDMSQINKIVSDQLWGAAKPIITGLANSFVSSGLALNRAIAGGISNQTGYQPTDAEAKSDWWFKNMIQPQLENRTATALPADAGFGAKATYTVGNLLGTLLQIGATSGESAVAEAIPPVKSVAGAIGEAVAHGSRAMAFPALTAAINTGKDVYDQTGDMQQAIRASQMSYVTTTAGGVVPLGAPGSLAMRLATGAASGIATGEVSRQAMNMVMPQQQGFDPEETILSGLSGAMLGGAMGPRALHDGVRQAYADGISAETAERGGAAVQQLSEMATASKLRQHDPEAFHAYVQQAAEDGPLTHVYVDGKTFADALHQSSIDPENIPGLSDRLQEAVNTGGDVQIPIEDYATHIAGSDLDKAIIPDLKTEEGGMTFAEGQQFYQNAKEEMAARAQDIMSTQGDADANQADVDKIGETLNEQMRATGRFPVGVSRASVAPVTEFYRTMAERTGQTPSDLFKQYPLRIAGEDHGDAGSLNQDAAAAVDSPEFKKWFSDSKVVDDTGAPKKVYHGTSSGGFDSFDAYGSNHGLFGQGVYTTEDPEVASSYTKKGKGTSPSVYPLHARIENPIDMDSKADAGAWADAFKDVDFEDAYKPDGDTNEAFYRQVEEHFRDEEYSKAEGAEAIQDGLRAMGHDGLTHIGGGRLDSSSVKHRVWVAFDPEQLKSSVGNRGTFDSSDASILHQESRGAFDPSSSTIALMKGADLSTFLHEAGHFFLSTLGDIAGRDGAPQQIKEDMQTAISWMGGKDIADWNGKSLDQQRDMHEKFARGFETYLMEGKAPTQAMQPLFSRFRSWLLNVYRSISGLGAELTPEVRGVFDRMLASDDAIKQAEQTRGYFPLDIEKSDATDAQKAAYAKLGDQATQDAISEMQAKSLKDMQWMSNAKAKVIKEMQRQHDTLRAAIHEDVALQVADEPVNLARQFLKTGESIDPRTAETIHAESGFKLDTAALKEMYPEGTEGAPNIKALKGLTAKGGMHPDDVAQIFGYGSGDELVRALADGEKPEATIKRLTDQRMLEEHGELTDPKAIEAAANLAVANHARARFMATGLKILSNSDIPANELAKAATEVAAKMIAAKRVRDLSPRQYEVAEAKANREAFAKAPKDPKGAVDAQRQALLSNRLARAAREAQTEVDKIVAEQKQYDKASIRKKMDLDILEQIDALRERFDFRRNPPDAEQKTAGQKSLSTWIRAQQDLGYSPLVNADMTNPTVRMHYRDMTVEQIRGFRDTVQSLETIARARKSVTVEGKQRDLGEVVDELVAKMKEKPDQFTMEQLVDKPRLGVDNPFTVALDRVSSFLRATAAELKPQQFKANALDGQEVLGPFTKTIFDRVFGANYRKIDMLKSLSDYFGNAVKENLGEEWQSRMTEEVPNKRLLDADLSEEHSTQVYRRLTRGDMLGIARHVGNESNFEKLTKGMDWDPRDVWLFLHDNMTEKDWEATQITWDAFDKHWPAMVDMNKRLGNSSPDHVEPRPFQTKFGDMKGGYAPLDYDPIRSRLGARKADSAAIDPSEGLFGKGYFRADTTTNGSLNGRIEGYFDRINLDYHSLERRLHDTVHDLAYREALIDVHKILMNKDFAKQFKLSNGPEQYKSMQTWLGNIANSGNVEGQTSKLVAVMSSFRRAIVANGIALRISTVLKHGGSAAFKSSGYFSGGGIKYFTARMRAIGTNHTAEVQGAMEKFSEIRARLMQQDRDYRQTSASLFQPESMHSKAERFGHSMVAWSDMMTAVPTAWAAYDRAITEGIPKNRGGTGAPMSEADAVSYANQIVREAHGSTIESSRSMLLAEKNEAVKMFTTLYGFMNNTLGQNMDMINKLNTHGFSKPEVLARFMMAMIVPALWAGVLAKPDKKDGWAAWSVKAIGGEAAGMVPMMRDAWSAIEGYSSAGMPAYMSALGAIAKPAQDIYHAAQGKEVKAPIKDLGNAIGLAIPGAGQVGTSLQYATDMYSGKQQPKNAVDVVRGLALGQGNN